MTEETNARQEGNTQMSWSDRLLVELNVKMDSVIESLKGKADKEEVAGVRREHEDLKNTVNRQWYWILGLIGSGVVTIGGIILTKLLGAG